MVTNTTIYTRQLYVSLSSDTPDVDFHNGDEVYLIDTRKRFIYDEENSTWYPLPTGGSAPVLTTKTITENGTYAASDDNADGYSEVTVNVQGSGYTASDWLDPTKPIGSIASDANSISMTVAGRTGITSVSMPNLTVPPESFLQGCTNLTAFNFPALLKPSKAMFSNCQSLEYAVFPSGTPGGSGSSYTFRNCSRLIGADFGGTGTDGISATFFEACVKLNKLVIRNTSVTPLLGIAAFTGSPFASGKAGGILYVPSALISSYQAATNWSTILGYPNNQILPIEGSVYETQYVDGTPIS